MIFTTLYPRGSTSVCGDVDSMEPKLSAEANRPASTLVNSALMTSNEAWAYEIDKYLPHVKR